MLGTAKGLASVVLMGKVAIGQPLFGMLIAAFGGGAGASAAELQSAFQTAIWVVPIAFFGAIICAASLRETLKKER